MPVAMLGAILLLAASASAVSAGPEATGQDAGRAPAIRATARATATIRILQAVRFGSDQLSGAEGATRRTTELTDASGRIASAELLEFQ